MNILLDTHYVLLLAGAQGRFTAAERAFLSTPGREFHVSAVSIWEIRLKWDARDGAGRRKGPMDPETVVRILGAANVAWTPLRVAHAQTALEPALQHSDPFDRLLLVQAQLEGLKLLTRDAQLTHHPAALSVGDAS